MRPSDFADAFARYLPKAGWTGTSVTDTLTLTWPPGLTRQTPVYQYLFFFS